MTAVSYWRPHGRRWSPWWPRPLADPRANIPHEEVRTEIMAEIEELERRIATSLPSSPAAYASHGGPGPGTTSAASPRGWPSATPPPR